MLSIASTSASGSDPFGLWGRAFRPFFLAAAIYAMLSIPWWVLVWIGALPSPGWLLPMWWHGHELIFGVVAAAIAGFLLTASPVWSGGPALTGKPLAALLGLWFAGRLSLAGASALPGPLVALVDAAFLPAVALAVVRTLWGSGQYRNYAVVGILVALAAANLVLHAEALGFVTGVAGRALRFAVDGVVVLLLVIGGRITPAFTQNALRRRGVVAAVETRAWPNALAVGAGAALAAADLLLGQTPATGLVAGIAAIAAGVRLAGWQSRHTGADPLLWSLHASAAWLVIGFALVAASNFDAAIPAAAGLHALTVGAIGSALLAVMTRVGLGHTGRALELPRGAVWCHALVHAAALLRVVAPCVSGVGQRALVSGSALAWAAAFGLFALCYWPILTTPRPDGRPG